MQLLRLTAVSLILTGCLIINTVFSDDNERNPHQIALSFDDAPMGGGFMFSGPERTDRLIEQLEKAKVPQVVFFCVTGKLPYHDGHARLEKYAAAGHLLGNHSHSHNRPGDVGALSYIEDIKQAHDILKQYSTFMPLYRYPMLDEGQTIPVRDSIREALNSSGYNNGYVTVDTWDWYIDKKCRDASKRGQKIDTVTLGRIYIETLWEAIQFYDNLALDLLGYSPRHVLLLHENDLAALFIDDLVVFLRQQGWEIISPTEAYSDPIAERIPDVLYNNQGRAAAIAVEQGYDGPLRHVSESAEYLDSLFQVNGVFHER
jgi:peptidoglycan/xylan/chitin deacetylase (PgdA/CDA1 family)